MVGETMITSNSGPIEALMFKEDLQAVNAVLQRMARKYRQALLDRVVEGLSFARIAQKEKCCPATAKSRYAVALKIIQRELRD